MKTLSDNLDVVVQTAGIAEGYATAKIYANGIGVFVGQTYIPGDGTPVTVNVNDIATQNHGKNDYIKLDDEGYVTTVPLESDGWGTYSIERRWNRGQIGNYKVTLNGMTPGQYPTPITYDNSIYALAGYDYINKNLKPLFINDDISINDTSLGRIMQGCDWIYNHGQEIGDFQNLLLPHYPLVKTDKYGFGLQIYVGNVTTEAVPTPYSLRRDMGPEIKLGSPIFGLSNTTFLTLDDLITGITGTNDNDLDVSVYLKHEDNPSTGDAFGQLIQGYDEYVGMVWVKEVEVVLKDGDEIISVDTYNMDNDEEEYQKVVNYMYRYLLVAPEIEFDFDSFLAEDPAYATFGNAEQVEAAMSAYVDLFVEKKLVGKDQGYDVYVEPMPEYDAEVDHHIPTHYIGKCPVAILDRCYSRYYLAWNDRYGDIMSQPFDGKIEFSEDITKDEIMDYKQRRRVSHKEVQSKWKLNTKWISESVYPIYEAIFTSPYLLLYDTETDRSWNVIVTDNKYNEKTYKNQKGLFNLEITVEANTTQNYIF